MFKSKSLFVLAAFIIHTFFPATSYAAEEKVLNVYNWVDYIGTDTVANFEKETGIKVRYDTYEDNGALDDKLRSKKSGYDVVVPSSDWAKSQINSGLLLKLDKTKIPNFKNLDVVFLDNFKNADPERAYLAGYLWGYTTLGVNVQKVTKALGNTPIPKNLWELAFNPTYTKKLKSCGITFLDSSNDIMPIALHYIRKQPYSNNTADYTAAAEMLKKVRPDIKYFASSGQAEKLADESVCLAIGWGADFYRARKIAKDKGSNQNIAPVFPDKGGLLFLDSMAIPKDAKHPENAHKFINYVLGAQVQAKISNDTKYANPNKASLKFVDPEMSTDKALFLSKQDLNKLIAPEALADTNKVFREESFYKFKSGR
jgi:putrescine transport system substrate-binding protein